MYHFYPSFASMYIFHSLKNEMYEYKINNSIVNFNIFSFLPYLGKWKVCFLLELSTKLNIDPGFRATSYIPLYASHTFLEAYPRHSSVNYATT